MLYDEKVNLFSRTSEYISIGITKGGVVKMKVGIPWESTAYAYNMCVPNVYIAPEDLEDKEVMSKIMTFKVIGCYIWTPLEDYMFISNFTELRDLSIMCGGAIRNLDFLKNLRECRMLFLEHAQLDNLDVLIGLSTEKEILFSGLKCVALSDCEVRDLSAFEREEHYFMEFLIWESEKVSGKKRWDKVCAAKKKYYKI